MFWIWHSDLAAYRAKAGNTQRLVQLRRVLISVGNASSAGFSTISASFAKQKHGNMGSNARPFVKIMGMSRPRSELWGTLLRDKVWEKVVASTLTQDVLGPK